MIDELRIGSLLVSGQRTLYLKEIHVMLQIHGESHRSERIGWLRAAVLGANDGTISVASLVVGVAVSGASQNSILLTGIAGLVAGAMSMAAGEYVSVQSQADTNMLTLPEKNLNLNFNRNTRRMNSLQFM